MRARWRGRFAWLAIVALLSNALLPSAFAVGIGSLDSNSNGIVWLGFCGAIPHRDAPARSKPGLIVHHCALCAAAQHVLLPPRHAIPLVALASVDDAFLPPRVREPNALFRNYRAQPRAPPTAA
jgi:Protein of unknown function (DUF2946)